MTHESKGGVTYILLYLDLPLFVDFPPCDNTDAFTVEHRRAPRDGQR